MNKENKLYIAYGSNMNQEQMANRCPYALVRGTAFLPDYELLFRGGGRNAVATVEPKKGASVPVLLWEITPRDEEVLDRYEGWPRLYRKETVEVVSGTQTLTGMIYIMNEGYPLGFPSEYYLETIIDGYLGAGIDKKYLEDAVRRSAEGGDEP